MYKYIVYNVEVNPFLDLVNVIHEKARYATKFNTYVSELNVTMNVHPIYRTNMFIPDYLRESFSRVRLMSHNLKIETGRWSRIPRENRVCRCNSIQLQTESHVLINCSLTHNIRTRYPMLRFHDTSNLFDEVTYICSLCKYVYEV